MMKSSRLEEDKDIEQNIINDVRNFFRLKKLKKEINNAAIKGKRNLLLKREDKAIKCRILKNISNLFEHEEEDYYKPVRVGNFRSYSYIEYKSKDDRETLENILIKLDHT